MDIKHPHINTFKKFYDLEFERVFQFLNQRLSNKEDAKDLTHDVFLKAYYNWDKLQKAETPSKYLFKITSNTLIDHYRKNILIEHSIQQLPPQQEVSSIELDQKDNEKVSALYQAIEQLPDQRKEIFKLKNIQGLSTEEIANELSLSKRTVENQVYRAMQSLRKQLANFFFTFF